MINSHPEMTTTSASRTPMTGRDHLIRSRSFLDPIPNIPGTPDDSQQPVLELTCETPFQPTIPHRWDRVLDELATKMPTVGKLCSLSRLQSFSTHGVLERTHVTVKEFIELHPSARRNAYPRDAKDILFLFHASIASSLGALVTPLGGEMTEAVAELVESILRDPLCLFDEDHIQLLWFLKRLTNEERLETTIAAVRARSAPVPPLVVDDCIVVGTDSIEEAQDVTEAAQDVTEETQDVIEEIQDEFEVEYLLEHNRYGDEPQNIEFLCRFKGFGAEEDLWLPVTKLSECTSLVDEYWARLHPLQYEIIPLDLSFDDMLDGRGVSAVTEAQVSLERFGVTDVTHDVATVASTVASTVATTVVQDTANFYRARRDGNLWCSEGSLSHTSEARTAFKEFCKDNKYDEALDTQGRNALRNWYYKALTTAGVVVARGTSTCGVVTRERFLAAVQRYEMEPMHPLLQAAGRKVFHLRAPLMKHCAHVCEGANDEMITARLREN